jgi:hypothetical protein
MNTRFFKNVVLLENERNIECCRYDFMYENGVIDEDQWFELIELQHKRYDREVLKAWEDYTDRKRRKLIVFFMLALAIVGIIGVIFGGMI